jgi:hypothetical protein
MAGRQEEALRVLADPLQPFVQRAWSQLVPGRVVFETFRNELPRSVILTVAPRLCFFRFQGVA